MMLPAGEMWSVVTESPKTPRQRAFSMPATGEGFSEKFSKKGGSWM